uniref:Ribonuclease H-like domain-containing protein n=1 Tax=Tanacetum cinerariifolium TaxID=118510 RepID=A0A6L2P9U3_TANCI|nr:ribonuclease H-like domain-containing protein [Tanacetum cinerariifolium]
MVKSCSSLENKACCSKYCKKNTDSLNSKIAELTDKLGDRENMLFHYKELKELKKEKKELDTKLTDDIITDYTRPSPSVESNPNGLQNNSSYVSKIGESTASILFKPAVKFVKAADCTEVKTNKAEAARKSSVRYAEMYRRTSKSPNRKNDVKARTTLLLALPDEHQLRFNKHKTAQELWAAILKTFGGNEATKKTKKNLLKQQYGNFKAEGSKTLEQTFNRLQVIISHLEFMDIEIKKDDLNQKFLTSLPPKWLMHTIVWRNRSDLDTMSLDDLYNHLKVYESKVQNKSELNSQNMAFISSAKHSIRNEEVNIASVSTASTNVSTASANIEVASISQDTACAYIASRSSCSQIKFEDINQMDKDDIEEMDIKWNMTLLSMRVDRAPRSQDRGRRDNYRQGSKVEEQALKAFMAIDGVGWDWIYMANDEENHALVADEEAPIEFALMAKTSAKSEVFDNSLCSKAWLAQVEARLAEHRNQEVKYCFQTALKDLDTLLESQILDKNKEGLRYNAVPPPPAQVYSPPKKYLSWTGLPEFADDTVTDYSRPTHTIKSYPDDAQNRNPFVTETEASPSNISYLSDYDLINGGYVYFGQGGYKITGKGTIKIGKLEFENVYFVKDLKYNMFSVSQICDNKNSVQFTNSKCIMLGRDFKLIDNTNVLLRTPRQHNMYSIDLKNIVPHKDLTCLVAKASTDEGMLLHRRLGHLNFKIMNRLVRHNLVRGLPSKCFENDHTCTACLKGKQHKASCTNSTNFLGTKDSAGQEVKKDVSSLRYIALPNWAHDALLESSSSKPHDECSTDVPKSSGNSNPTATLTNPSADLSETLTQVETPSLDNILTLTNRFEDILGVTTNSDESNGVEADVSNMETTITASPTLTLRIHKDHPKRFTVYQTDVKSAFLYGTIDEEVYVMQPPGFHDLEFPAKVYKVEKAMYGLHQAPRAWYDKYVRDILKKFRSSDVRSSNTPMDKENPWGKDGTRKDVDLHLYRSMIGSLMYLTASRPDIMFAICAYARHQLAPKECHLHTVKRIFRYLKGHPKLGLWYPTESPFDLVAYSDNDYGGATQDRKSTTRGC